MGPYTTRPRQESEGRQAKAGQVQQRKSGQGNRPRNVDKGTQWHADEARPRHVKAG